MTEEIRTPLCSATVIAVENDNPTDEQLDEMWLALITAMSFIRRTPRGRASFERVDAEVRAEMARRAGARS